MDFCNWFLPFFFFFLFFLCVIHLVKHIKRVDGLAGCYRGLAPKLVGSVIGVIGSKRVADKLGLDEVEENDGKDDSEITEQEW